MRTTAEQLLRRNKDLFTLESEIEGQWVDCERDEYNHVFDFDDGSRLRFHYDLASYGRRYLEYVAPEYW